MSNLVLSIIIPVFNKFAFTKSCLNDLSKLPDNHEIIVFDNGSTDETKKELEQWSLHPNFKYIRSDINGGFAFAINRAYQQSRAPNVMMLNNDIRVKSNHTTWTQSVIEHCDKYLVGPTMGQLDKDFNFIKEANEEIKGYNTYLSGWCLASSKKIFDKLKFNDYVGPMSEEYFCYFEDTDMGFNARKLGIPLKVVGVPVVHFGKQSSKQLNTYELYKKARAIFVNKWSKNK